MRKALTIAGSDSGGGAGIQGDLKVFAAHGIYGMSAITALTAQNTLGVQGIFPIPSSFVKAQIDSVMQDIKADIWKTGMLLNADIIEVVVERWRYYEVEHLVVDPVMISSSGKPLLDKRGIEALERDLLPITTVLTPNCDEATVLTGIVINTLDDMQKAALKIHEMGVQNIIIKGGHLPEQYGIIDLLFDGETFEEQHSQRIKTNNSHGTGCAFASSLASQIAKGASLSSAFKGAHDYVNSALQQGSSLRLGHGKGSLQHFPTK